MAIENPASQAALESFADGTPVRFVVSEGPAVGGGPSAGDEETSERARRAADRPDGMGTAVPVGRGGQIVANMSGEVLRQTLRPIKPLLEEVHHAASRTAVPPSELSVSFGVQIGSDLKFGVVSANGQAHLTVSASWQLSETGQNGADTSTTSQDGEDDTRPEGESATGTA
ncbi:CU044_2847 family protein [Streptomyces fractus]|uniref:CU044_2847 family protein n=1 Tax=Streptomyces fractus TaxID=641806 RepID=UPI003CF99B89